MDNKRDILNKLANGSVVKAANGDEYIILSSVDSNQKTKGTKVRAEEYVIKVSDFLAGVGTPSEYCNITMKQIDPPVYAGPITAFEKPDYADPAVTRDIIIPGVLEIARKDNQGLYNYATETGFDTGGYTSPEGTQWASLETDGAFDADNYTAYPSFTYYDWVSARDFAQFAPQTLIMWHVATNRYWRIEMTSWTEGAGGGVGAGGGFAYTRQEIFPNATTTEPYCELTFSDGTVQTSAPVDTNTNSWGMDTVAFVSPLANPGTGAVGFANLQLEGDTTNTAFRTVQEANASGASTVFILPSTTQVNIQIADGITYYAFPGVKVNQIYDGGVSNITARILGDALVQYGIILTGSNNTLDVVCDRFESRLFANVSISTTNNHVKIKANKCLQTVSWGGAYAVRTGNDSSVEIECSEMSLLYWLVATRSYNCTYKVRCPKVTVNAGGGFGNQYKSLINHQGSVAGNNIYDIDFMGGTFETLAPQTSSFGVSDSALLLCPAMLSTDTSQFIFSNGRVKANAVFAVLVNYQVRKCRLELNNLDISCNTNAFSFWNQAINSAGQDVEITFRDCNIESNAFCQIGNARFVKFYNTNIKVLTGANIVNFKADNGATPGTAYFYNCNLDLVDPGEALTNFTGVSVGLANCYGDQPVGATVVDLYSGYTQLTPFELPNLVE